MDYPEMRDFLDEKSGAEIPKHGVVYHSEIYQGSDEWKALRCGLLTASEMKLIITPMLKVADNDKSRSHLYELLAQRITGYVEPHYVGDDMLRGKEDEIDARALYSKNIAAVQEIGFITNDEFGFTIGYSPDGLIGNDGLLEVKGRRQKFQIETIINRTISDDYLIQVQTGLLVSKRKYLDFVSYCGGLPFEPIRVYPDAKIQRAIIEAATAFEAKMVEKFAQFKEAAASRQMIKTERRIVQEMFL